jgi:hypothetical protein
VRAFYCHRHSVVFFPKKCLLLVVGNRTPTDAANVPFIFLAFVSSPILIDAAISKVRG